jgi:hypothetical protein
MYQTTSCHCSRLHSGAVVSNIPFHATREEMRARDR